MKKSTLFDLLKLLAFFALAWLIFDLWDPDLSGDGKFDVSIENEESLGKIIIEDIYSNLVQKYLTFFTDSLVNLEFRGHPHSNKSVRDWNKLFNELSLKIIHEEINQVYGLFNQALFVVEK